MQLYPLLVFIRFAHKKERHNFNHLILFIFLSLYTMLSIPLLL